MMMVSIHSETKHKGISAYGNMFLLVKAEHPKRQMMYYSVSGEQKDASLIWVRSFLEANQYFLLELTYIPE